MLLFLCPSIWCEKEEKNHEYSLSFILLNFSFGSLMYFKMFVRFSACRCASLCSIPVVLCECVCKERRGKLCQRNYFYFNSLVLHI